MSGASTSETSGGFDSHVTIRKRMSIIVGHCVGCNLFIFGFLMATF